MNDEWDRVDNCLDRLSAYRPESPDEFDAAAPAALTAARVAAGRYRAAGRRVPDDVFPMPDGGVMFLWADGGTHLYIDFDRDGISQEMKTYKDGRPPEFRDIEVSQ